MFNEKLNSIRFFNSVFSNKKLCNSSSKISFSIKPIAYNIPNDICGKDIFLKMIELTKDENHLILYKKMTNKEKSKRNYIIGLMKDFIHNNKINYKILYSAIFFFDILLNINSELSIEQIGLGSLIIVSKFFYEKHCNIRNQIFRNFGKKEVSSEEINIIEIKCLKILNYKLNYIQPIFFLDLLFLNGIVFTTDNIKTEDSTKVYNLSLKLLEYSMEINNEYIKYHPFSFCCGIIALCRKKYNLHKWHESLEKTFQISFEDFSDIYYILKDHYKDMKNQNNEQTLKIKSVSSEKTKKHISPFEFNISPQKFIKKKYEEEKLSEIENEKENDEKYISPQKNLNINEIKKTLLFKTPIKKNPKVNVNNPLFFHRNLFLKNNLQNSIITDDNKKNNNNNFKTLETEKRIKKDNFGGLFRQKSRNYKLKYTNNMTSFQSRNNGFNTTRNSNNNFNILNNGLSENSPNNTNIINFSNVSSIVNEDDELNKKNPSLEHYKRFNNKLNNKIPNYLIERRVRNLSSIVNHLFSNHTNNIL